MKPHRQTTLPGAAFLLCLLLTGCSPDSGALDPRGPIADDIAIHWWLMFWMGLSVYLLVAALLLFAIFRARRNAPTDDKPPINDRYFFGVAGLAIPAVILIIVLVDSARTGQSIIDPPDEPALTIEVIGHQFWWEVHYPDHDVTTANEIHIPAGEPVEFRLTSAEVIHSFWIPELAGKRDLNPDAENVVWIQADEPGTYWGQCAEFCGVQHALMGIVVNAQPTDEFDEWITIQQQPATPPDDELLQRGMEIYLNTGCAMCHNIDGITDSTPDQPAGPDLTHIASRDTLASGITENNESNMAIWVRDPHEIKPGVRMPTAPLSDDELAALVAFLFGLE